MIEVRHRCSVSD